MEYTPLIAATLSMIVAGSYVAVFQWMKPAALRGLNRNHPLVMKYRMKRISFLCVVLLVTTPFLLVDVFACYQSRTDVLKMLGLPSVSSKSIFASLVPLLRSLLLIAGLYIGPIANYVRETRLQYVVPDFQDAIATLAGFRDHVFAPVTEEFIYRSVILTLLTPVNGVAYSPLLFGVAHLHHAYELYFHQGIQALVVALNAGVQFCYTTIFGVLANHVFVDIGKTSLVCSAVVHSVCNMGGVPDLTVDWIPYYGLLVAGVVIFWWVY